MRWVYLSFSPLPLASLLFSAICKASSENHFAFLHFFFGIGVCCFETHADVPDAVRAVLGEEAQSFIVPAGEKFRVDLKGVNAALLRRAGVRQIEVSRECTACEPDRFWSHRRVGNDRGSLAAIIVCEGGNTK